MTVHTAGPMPCDLAETWETFKEANSDSLCLAQPYFAMYFDQSTAPA